MAFLGPNKTPFDVSYRGGGSGVPNEGFRTPPLCRRVAVLPVLLPWSGVPSVFDPRGFLGVFFEGGVEKTMGVVRNLHPPIFMFLFFIFYFLLVLEFYVYVFIFYFLFFIGVRVLCLGFLFFIFYFLLASEFYV